MSCVYARKGGSRDACMDTCACVYIRFHVRDLAPLFLSSSTFGRSYGRISCLSLCRSVSLSLRFLSSGLGRIRRSRVISFSSSEIRVCPTRERRTRAYNSTGESNHLRSTISRETFVSRGIRWMEPDILRRTSKIDARQRCSPDVPFATRRVCCGGDFLARSIIQFPRVSRQTRADVIGENAI